MPQPSTTETQLATFKAAVAPDHHSRSAYTGQVYQTERVTIIADDGTCFERDVTFPVSWNSILKILSLINKRVES